MTFNLTFSDWWQELKKVAEYMEWELGDPSSYKEYYDDGDSPEATIDMEMSYVDDECDSDDIDQQKFIETRH